MGQFLTDDARDGGGPRAFRHPKAITTGRKRMPSDPLGIRVKAAHSGPVARPADSYTAGRIEEYEAARSAAMKPGRTAEDAAKLRGALELLAGALAYVKSGYVDHAGFRYRVTNDGSFERSPLREK